MEKVMQEEAFKVIDLRGRVVSEKLYSRLVWQELFDFYKGRGSNLDNMNDMLCDLYSIEQFFKECHGKSIDELDKMFGFLWSCHTVTTEFSELGIPHMNNNTIRVEYVRSEKAIKFYEENGGIHGYAEM